MSNQRRYPGRFSRHRPPRQSAGHTRAGRRPLPADHFLSRNWQRITGAARIPLPPQIAKGLVNWAATLPHREEYAVPCAEIQLHGGLRMGVLALQIINLDK